MAERVVLHVGTMKSGTTYLQDVLSSGALERVGAFYAGGTFGAQTRAVRRLLRPAADRDPGPWRDLVAKARERDGVAVVSQEFLSFARPERVRMVVDSFGGLPVEVVLTVRDQHRAIPAQWQSFTRNRGEDGWARYLRRLQRTGPRGRSKARASFRRAQDVRGILGRWTQPGVSATSVVVVPPAGSAPTDLWRRFCQAARLDAGDPPAAGTPSNESLGYASCDVLRRVNGHLASLDMRRYKQARKELLEPLFPLRAEEGRPLLDADGTDLACRLNALIVEAVSRDDVRLVGSPAELPVEPGPAPASPPPPDPDRVRRAVEAAWRGCVGTAVPSGDVDDVVARLGRHLADRFGR